MAIIDGFTSSFKKELLEAIHDLSSDVIKIALYSESATLNASTTAYTTTGEVSGTGYSAGGAIATMVTPSIIGTTAIADIADLTFSTVTISVRGALIYNSSKANRAIRVLDFGLERTKTSADLVLQFPTADELNAVIRVI